MNAMGVSGGSVTSAPTACLMCRLGDRLLAVPLAHVVETMRPLPLQAVSGVPSFILGVAVIRGAVVPVLDMGSVLGMQDSGRPGRFVTIAFDDRLVALAVESVVDIRTLDDVTLHDIPPLIGVLGGAVLSAIGTLDSGLLLVLGDARLVTDEDWARLDELNPTEAVAAL